MVSMKVLYISQTDSGGQGYLLARAMREHLGWDAKSLTMSPTYLDYDYDWLATEENKKDIEKFAKDTDFFIMQDRPIEINGLEQYMNTKNVCIHGLGSPLRNQLPLALIHQLRNELLIVPPAADQTITPNLMASAMFESVIINVDEIDRLTQGIHQNDELTVCCAVTEKKQPFIEETKSSIEDLGLKLEIVSGQSWRETIHAKARAHIILDPPSQYKAPGINCWEAIYMGSIPVGPYSAWSHSVHPEMEYYTRSYNDDARDDEPSEGRIHSALRSAKNETEGKLKLSKETQKYDTMKKQNWIRENYSPERVVQRWKWWITWAIHRRD